MIHPSFIPPRAVRELRDLTRRRKRLLGNATSERNRIQKVLEHANVKLGNELSDVFGVSGQRMLDALLEGKAPAEEIAQLTKKNAKKKILTPREFGRSRRNWWSRNWPCWRRGRSQSERA